MPGLTSSLSIGLSGLQASQAALNVVGHNIANVNTAGYSRQRAVLSTNASHQFGTLQFGSGVTLSNIMGVRDRFLDMQITESTSKQSGANARYNGVEGIASLFNDQTEAGLDSQIHSFFAAFSTLATQPEDQSLRTNLIGKAQTMIQGFQTKYQALTDQRNAADKAVLSEVQEVNTLTSQISALNSRIAAETVSGADNDARDQRQALVNQLAGVVGIQVYEDDKSRMIVSLTGGAAVLVGGDQAYSMTATTDPANSNYQRVEVQMGATSVDVTKTVTDGEMGANLDLRDNILAGYQRQLDQLAAGIVGSVNAQHRTGYDLSGTAVAGTAGEDFFKGGGANYAASNLALGQVAGLPTTVSSLNGYQGMVNSLSVNSAIVSNPKLIAAANAAGAPGNNGNARALANLANLAGTVDTDGNGVGDSGPFSTSVGSLVNTIGTDSQGFSVRATNDDNLITALQTQRDRISGVDLDEEATNLIAFQRGYQASARFISVINQLTDQLVNQLGA